MIKKKDLCKVFFIYLCMVHVCPAHPCGENPLRGLTSLARMSGKKVEHLLNLLREANYNLYSQLESQWQTYAHCVGMVETGYFKRSGSAAIKLKNPFRKTTSFGQPLSLWNLLSSSRKQNEMF